MFDYYTFIVIFGIVLFTIIIFIAFYELTGFGEAERELERRAFSWRLHKDD